MTATPAKAPTGIEGLDDMTAGGIPKGRATLVTGGPGAGKTIFALQALIAGAATDEPGIFVAFEETSAAIQAHMAGFSWDLRRSKRKLVFMDAQMAPGMEVTGAFDLQGLLAALSAKVAETRAKRIAFDAIDVLLGLLDSPALAAIEMRRLREWLDAEGLTAIITAKADACSGATLEPFSFMEFLVDCGIALRLEVVAGTSHRSLRVLKYRGSAFSENVAPMVIGANGLDVASPRSPMLASKNVFTEKISTGVADLDGMFEGGYYRGSSILVTGAPGTAKSTLSGAFTESACARGEPTLFVSFDSDPLEIVRNLGSVGIRLARFQKSGLLNMYSSRGNAGSAEVHLLTITGLARDLKARCIVIDPISALVKAGNEAAGLGVSERLIDWAKHRGITVLCTSLLNSAAPEAEGTPMQISTIADTWIHLSYVINAGERNRAITIVKSRGVAHSNQVRELILSSRGISLSEVYTAEGQVLMGTMRWQKEQDEKASRLVAARELALRHQAARAGREELATRIAGLQQAMQAKDTELALLLEAQASQDAAVEARHDEMVERRGGRGRAARRLPRNVP